MSNLGFRTQKEAIAALTEDGVPARQIAARLGVKIQTVYSRQTEIRKDALGLTWTPERITKAKRIHEAALGVIAEALHVSVGQLKLALAWPDAAPIVVEIAAEAAPSAPEKVANLPQVLRTKPAPKPIERLYRFVTVDGKWLHEDGGGFTTDPDAAWRGTSAAVKAARPMLHNAKFCKMAEIR
jgi:hypothetical protein